MEARYSQAYDSNRFPARNVIDGSVQTLGLTPLTGQEWVSVALDANNWEVRLVHVVNRQDQYAFWLNDFEIWVGTDFGDLRTLCGRSNYARNLVISCGGAEGSHVTLLHRGSQGQALTIAELEVYLEDIVHPPGTPPSSPCADSCYEDRSGWGSKCNMAQCEGCPACSLLGTTPLGTNQYIGARMSTPYYVGNRFHAELVIDGNVETICLSATGGREWVSVELATVLDVAHVEVINRQDGYAYILATFEIWIGDAFGDMRSLCGSATYDPSAAGQRYTVNCAQLSTQSRGSHVTLQHRGSSYLSIAELIVHVPTPSPSPPSPMVPSPPANPHPASPLPLSPQPAGPQPAEPPPPNLPQSCPSPAILSPAILSPASPSPASPLVRMSPPLPSSRPPLAAPPGAVGRCAGWCAASPKQNAQKCAFANCGGCDFCLSSGANGGLRRRLQLNSLEG